MNQQTKLEKLIGFLLRRYEKRTGLEIVSTDYVNGSFIIEAEEPIEAVTPRSLHGKSEPLEPELHLIKFKGEPK